MPNPCAYPLQGLFTLVIKAALNAFGEVSKSVLEDAINNNVPMFFRTQAEKLTWWLGKIVWQLRLHNTNCALTW